MINKLLMLLIILTTLSSFTNRPPKPCREPFTECWCETRPNNPHCDKYGVPIDDGFGILFFIGLGLGFYVIKKNKICY